MWGPGASQGKEAWPSRSEGVAVPAELGLHGGKEQSPKGSACKAQAVLAAPSIPHYAKPAIAITNPSFLF